MLKKLMEKIRQHAITDGQYKPNMETLRSSKINSRYKKYYNGKRE